MRGKYEKPRNRTDLKRVAAVGAVITLLGGGGGIAGVAEASSGTGSNQVSTSTARVVRTDLASTQQVAGSIGYDGSYTMVNPAGANAQAITQAHQALAQARAAMANDQTSASDTSATNAQAISQAQAAINAAQTTLDADKAKQSADCAGAGSATPGCAQDAQKVSQEQAQLAQQQASLATAQLNATKSKHQDDAKLQSDTLQAQNAETSLNTLLKTAANPGATYTALPGVGQVISQGQQLYAIDGKPVPLFYGTTPLWRSFQLGMSDGPDVGELTQNLIALGFGAGNGLTQSDHYSQATADAVKRWQASLGVDQTGVIRLGEVQFEPSAIRITSVHPTLGAAVTPGPLMDATSTTRVVTVALAVTKEYLVHQGDAVSVLLPDGKTTTQGHVRDISTVATTPSGGNGNSSTPTVNVVVTLDHPNETGALDQAPVNVNVTDQSVRGVLAVPINALLALAEGGDAVEVVSPAGHHLVPVQVGLFSDTMVQISGAGITEGAQVEVPSS
jgi:hypothetical protein